jgi:hypothetical protein
MSEVPLYPKSNTRDPEPTTRHPQSDTWNPNPETLLAPAGIVLPATLYPREVQNTELDTQDANPET